MLRVIISPAKKMNPGSDAFAPRAVPMQTPQATRLLAALEALTEEQLQALWNVSDRLLPACLNTLDSLRRTGLPTTSDNLADPAWSARLAPALFAYVGLQYQSIAPGVLDEDALAWMADHLRIISGFYGCVRPFDAVLPYRLEMGARLEVDGQRDLYGYWGASIAEALGADLPPHDTLQVVNLASVEYARAVLPHLSARSSCTTCLFGESVRNGKPVQRSTASKTARGSMVRWMAERAVSDPEDLAHFDLGYRYEPGLSRPDTLVFMRNDAN